MPPKKAAPPLCPRCVHKPRRCPVNAPVRFLTLHLYRPNGEFVIEVIQRHDGSICRFVQDLEDGHITPALQLELWESLSGPCYRLVWNDMVLEEGQDWWDVVVEHGMSFIEINIITVVRLAMLECP